MNDSPLNDPPVRRRRGPNYVKAAIGAAGGVALGYFAFSWLIGQGIYGMVIPGALVGLGCGSLADGRSLVCGALAAVTGLGLSLFLEWHFRPFVADPSLSYFLQNLSQLKGFTLLTVGAGTFAAFWFGRGR